MRTVSVYYTKHEIRSAWYSVRGWYRPFAQLLPGLETGHPVTVGQSSAYDFSVSDEQKAVFLVSVSDFSECDSYAGD